MVEETEVRQHYAIWWEYVTPTVSKLGNKKLADQKEKFHPKKGNLTTIYSTTFLWKAEWSFVGWDTFKMTEKEKITCGFISIILTIKTTKHKAGGFSVN